MIFMRKGDEKPGHKYYKRVDTGKRVNGKIIYKYFYSKEEYEKTLAGKFDKVGETVKNKADFIASKTKNTTSDISSRVKKGTDKVSNLFSNKYDKAINAAQKRGIEQTEYYRKMQKKQAANKAADVAQRRGKEQTEYYKGMDKKRLKIEQNKNLKKIQEEKDKRANDSVYPKDHKYLAKIPLGNGKFKYIYDYDELLKYKNANPKAFINLPLAKDADTPDEDMATTNPNYSKWDKNTTQNCAFCSIAYDLKRRGYDVKALEVPNEYLTSKGIRSLYGVKGSDVTTIKSSEQMINSMKSNGEGSYGMLNVYWNEGSGHSMIWSVENGDVVIRDTQVNKTYKGNEINSIMSHVKTEPSFNKSTPGIAKNIINTISKLEQSSDNYNSNFYRLDDKKPSSRVTNYVGGQERVYNYYGKGGDPVESVNRFFSN